MSKSDKLSFADLAELANQCLRSEKAFRKLKAENRRKFSWELAFVAAGVRTGCLVDVISVDAPLEHFAALILKLRQRQSCFQHLKHIYEPQSNQSFILNSLLLHPKPLDSSHFVDVTPERGSPSMLLEYPELFVEAVKQLQLLVAQPDPSVQFTLPGTKATLAIPLAAFILDYQVAYVLDPVSPESAILGNVPLDVYECEIDDHSLMKFSCPQSLGVKYPNELGSMAITQRLRDTLSRRINVGSSLRITYHTMVNDRVAL